MAKAIIDEQNLTDIADAIRAKNGSADTYLPSEMATAIGDLPTPTPVTKGLVFSDYDADGYPTKAEFVGFTVIPPNYCANLFANGAESKNNIFKNFFNIVIPSEVTEIGVTAFFDCRHLTSITLNEGLTKIGSYSIGQCYGLTSITLPTTITTFVGATFAQNINMGTVTFLGNVPDITNNCFNGCSKVNLYDFSNHTGTIPSLYSTASLGHASGCVIKVPSSLLSTWQTTAVWQDLTGVVWQGV